MHYGLLPRANRGIFAINELPDLARQGAGGPVQHHAGRRRPDQRLSGAAAARRPALLHREPRGLHGARQDHHAAQGPHRQRDHHALSRDRRARHGDHGAGGVDRRGAARELRVPDFMLEVVERVAFEARNDKRIDKRSGVSQRMPISVLENVVSNAERRAILLGETEDRAAHLRRLRRAARDHRQDRARVRGRAAGRRRDRARADPPRGRPRLEDRPGGANVDDDRRLVRRGRRAQGRATTSAPSSASRASASCPGCSTSCPTSGFAPGRYGAAPVAACELVLEGLAAAQAHQPERGAGLHAAQAGAARSGYGKGGISFG